MAEKLTPKPFVRTWTHEDVKQAVAESTEKSGVPYHLEDESALADIAALFAPKQKRAAS